MKTYWLTTLLRPLSSNLICQSTIGRLDLRFVKVHLDTVFAEFLTITQPDKFDKKDGIFPLHNFRL